MTCGAEAIAVVALRPESDQAADVHTTADELAAIAAPANVANIAQASTAVIAREATTL